MTRLTGVTLLPLSFFDISFQILCYSDESMSMPCVPIPYGTIGKRISGNDYGLGHIGEAAQSAGQSASQVLTRLPTVCRGHGGVQQHDTGWHLSLWLPNRLL